MSAAARSQVFCKNLAVFVSVTKKDFSCLFGIFVSIFIFLNTSAGRRCEFTLHWIHHEDVEDCSLRLHQDDVEDCSCLSFHH